MKKFSLTCDSIVTLVAGVTVALFAPKTYADVITQLQYQKDIQEQRRFEQVDISK